MFRGSDLDFTFPGCGILAVVVIISIPFGIWKIIELLYYIITHLQWVS